MSSHPKRKQIAYTTGPGRTGHFATTVTSLKTHEPNATALSQNKQKTPPHNQSVSTSKHARDAQVDGEPHVQLPHELLREFDFDTHFSATVHLRRLFVPRFTGALLVQRGRRKTQTGERTQNASDVFQEYSTKKQRPKLPTTRTIRLQETQLHAGSCTKLYILSSTMATKQEVEPQTKVGSLS